MHQTITNNSHYQSNGSSMPSDVIMNKSEWDYLQKTFDLRNMWLSSASDRAPCCWNRASHKLTYSTVRKLLLLTWAITYPEWAFLVMRYQCSFSITDQWYLLMVDHWCFLRKYLDRRGKCGRKSAKWNWYYWERFKMKPGGFQEAQPIQSPPCETELLNWAKPNGYILL